MKIKRCTYRGFETTHLLEGGSYDVRIDGEVWNADFLAFHKNETTALGMFRKIHSDVGNTNYTLCQMNFLIVDDRLPQHLVINVAVHENDERPIFRNTIFVGLYVYGDDSCIQLPHRYVCVDCIDDSELLIGHEFYFRDLERIVNEYVPKILEEYVSKTAESTTEETT